MDDSSDWLSVGTKDVYTVYHYKTFFRFDISHVVVSEIQSAKVLLHLGRRTVTQGTDSQQMWMSRLHEDYGELDPSDPQGQENYGYDDLIFFPASGTQINYEIDVTDRITDGINAFNVDGAVFDSGTNLFEFTSMDQNPELGPRLLIEFRQD